MTQFKAACVIGYPAQHSRSPLIHGHWLHTYGLQGAYMRETVAAEDLPQFIASLRARGYVGANITVPHKEAVFQLVQKPDEIATALHAVNTIWFEDGVLCGSNSDGLGFLKSLDHQTPGWRDGCNAALVLGAGGAARGIVYALLQAGVQQVHVYNRTIEKAHALHMQFGTAVQAISAEQLPQAYAQVQLIVNTTSIGMDGTSSPPHHFEACAPTTVVNDIVYTPLHTPFLHAAQQHSLRVAYGLDMLLYQATIGFEKWFGVVPEVTDEVRNLILADLGQGK